MNKKVGKPRTIDYSLNVCSVDNCDFPYYAKAYCRFHYNRALKGISFGKAFKGRNINGNEALSCSFTDCVNNRTGKQLYCEAHYKQEKYIGTLTPIKHRKQFEINSEGRECSQCGRFQTWDNYYKRTGGKTHQANCKECAKKWSSSHNTPTYATSV